MRLLATALIALFLVTGCGDGGSAVAPTGPAPRLPLTWTDVPDSLTVERGETVTFTATLSAAVDASVAITASDRRVEVSGEWIRAGVFRGTVTAVGAGAVSVSLVATHPGYHRADATVAISVGATFDERIWRQMVFAERDCPNPGCELFPGRSVEERTVRVLPFVPNFHVVNDPSDGSRPEGIDRFSESEMANLEIAIRDAVQQLTGKRFGGEITSSSERKKEYGWIDVLPVTDAWFPEEFGDSGVFCGVAQVGKTSGEVSLNVERMRTYPACQERDTMLHEIGHALGFYHIDAPGDHIMGPGRESLGDFTADEQLHAVLAHELGRDAPYTSDPRSPSSRGSQLRGYPERPDDIMIFCPAH